MKDLHAVLVWDFKAASAKNVRLKDAKNASTTAISVTHAVYPTPKSVILNARNAQKAASHVSRELKLAIYA